jgi:hypothetical protein
MKCSQETKLIKKTNHMKTRNFLRNAAIVLMMVLPASFTFSQGENETSENLNRDRLEFAKAGYWIDPVIVNSYITKADKETLAGQGYFIEPVVVTYYLNAQKDVYASDNTELLKSEDGKISISGGGAGKLEVSMLSKD